MSVVGETISRYRVLEKIGEGGTGEVYLAQDASLERNVVLKLLSRRQPSATRQRLLREARAAAALDHPYICKIYEVSEAEGRPFIVMEYIEGMTLEERLQQGRLSVAEAVGVAASVADALEVAHRKNIVHRDMKPSNIMLTSSGHVKVLDFGIAKQVMPEDEEDITLLTQEGVPVGTVPYMSPEQAWNQPVDARSDIFSLGVVLYESLTGVHPFHQPGQFMETALAILKHKAPPLSESVENVPDLLEQTVERMMAKDPEERFQDVRQVRSRLEQVLELGRVGPGVAALLLRPRRLARFAATLLLLAGAALLIWYLASLPGAGPLPPPRLTLSRLTDDPGQEVHPAMSPDGKSIVYFARGDIFLKRVKGQTAINLTPDSPGLDTQPAFSPDGELIAFRSERDEGGLFVMGATGESVKRLTTFGSNPSWSPDGREIAFATEPVTDPRERFSNSQLWVVSVETGETRVIEEVGDGVQPAWSPRGHRIAYWGLPLGSGNRNIWTVGAQGGHPVPVSEDPAVDWSPAWSADGRHLYFSSDRGGSMNIWRVQIDEESGRLLSRPQMITSGTASLIGNLSVSQTGRHIAYEVQNRRVTIQKVGFDPDSEQATGDPAPVTERVREWTYLHVSPGGDQLVVGVAGAQEDLFVMGTDGSDFRQLTDDAAKDRMPKWSPDGEKILFFSDRSGAYEIWTIEADGGGLHRLTETPGESLTRPSWSPDGKRVAYFSDLKKVPFLIDPRLDWSEQEPASLPGLDNMGGMVRVEAWSPDGKILLCSHREEGSREVVLYLYDLETHTVDPLLGLGSNPVWLSDSRRFLTFVESNLYLVDSRTMAVSEIVSLGTDTFASVAVSRDDRTIYFTRRSTESDVWSLELQQ